MRDKVEKIFLKECKDKELDKIERLTGVLEAGLPRWPVVKNLPHAEVVGSIPGQEDPVEKEMAAHSSVLAWKIP